MHGNQGRMVWGYDVFPSSGALLAALGTDVVCTAPGSVLRPSHVHELKFLGVNRQTRLMALCDAPGCGRKLHGALYCCEGCDFDMHLACAFPLEPWAVFGEELWWESVFVLLQQYQ